MVQRSIQQSAFTLNVFVSQSMDSCFILRACVSAVFCYCSVVGVCRVKRGITGDKGPIYVLWPLLVLTGRGGGGGAPPPPPPPPASEGQNARRLASCYCHRLMLRRVRWSHAAQLAAVQFDSSIGFLPATGRLVAK